MGGFCLVVELPRVGSATKRAIQSSYTSPWSLGTEALCFLKCFFSYTLYHSFHNSQDCLMKKDAVFASIGHLEGESVLMCSNDWL